MYSIIDKVDGYIEENSGNKDLTLVSTDKNKEVLIKHTEPWYKIKNQDKYARLSLTFSEDLFKTS